MSDQSVLLTRFYVDWYHWAKQGAPAHPFFRSEVGLCSNLCNWTRHDGCAYIPLLNEQDALFVSCFDDDAYPFGVDAYDHDFARGTQHLNPRRLEWVFSRIQ